MMLEQKTRAWIFSQQSLFLQGVRQSLSDQNIEVAGEARAIDKMPKTIEIMPPEVAIVDIDEVYDTGINLARRIKQVTPSTAVIIMSSSDDDDYLFKAIKVQAAAYIAKSVSGKELCDVVKSVVKGEQPIKECMGKRPKVAEKILNQFTELSKQQEVRELISPLTSREVEIVDYMAQGFANKQIAAKLHISEQTIKNHVTSILGKLDANARTEAVVKAIKKGFISIEQ